MRVLKLFRKTMFGIFLLIFLLALVFGLAIGSRARI